MNIYHGLNEIVEYIENHLEEPIDYQELAKILCVNEYTMQRLFSLLCNISLADYIRKRRLSYAGFDIYKNEEKIMDIAIKYQYDSATAFSRAFEKFHGIKPSQAKNNPNCLKVFSKLHFDETVQENEHIAYRIEDLEAFTLWGKGIKTDFAHIDIDAPAHFRFMQKQYEPLYGHPPYGMVVYENRNESSKCEYWVLYKQKIPHLEKYEIPKSKWLSIRISSQNEKDIQQTSHKFYKNFLPSCNYNLKPLPELEYYHDNLTDFLIPIED